MRKNLTTKEIVKKWLSENGYDGLFNPDAECACELCDLFSCGAEGVEECFAGYREECRPEECSHGGDCVCHMVMERIEGGE